MKLTVVLHNIRSTYNVGAILRTAEGFGVEKVILSGYTPWYDKPGLLPHLAEKLEHQITKTAVGADKLVKTEWVEDLPAWLDNLPEDVQKLGLENNLEDDRLKTLGDFTFDDKLSELKSLAYEEEKSNYTDEKVLVLGEEVHGIPPEVLAKLDVLLEIPMRGRKESFNVSVAAGIAIYELMR